VRVAFVGPALPFSACVPSEPAGGLEPHFVEHPPGAEPRTLRARLDELRPAVVVVFGAEHLAAGVLDGLDAATLGVLGGPWVPAGVGGGWPAAAGEGGGWSAGEGVGRSATGGEGARGDGAGPSPAAAATGDAGQFDRLLSAGATGSPGALPVWRALPPAVDDRFYAPLRPAAMPPRIAFLGASTERRERWLIDAKHELDVLHVASGLRGDALRERLARIDIALNVHATAGPAFEPRVALHLAAGHLVVTEPLAPRHGLRPGVELLEVASPEALLASLRALRTVPGAHEDVRRAGRRAAERFRASRVWPRLLEDLTRDLRAFGTVRRGGAGGGGA
jgi:hypothetical protein